MNVFSLEILAADKVFYQGDCRSLMLPTPDGQYGILARHENTIIAVATGIGSYTDADGKRQNVVFSTGICKVEDNSVLVLVQTAERPEEIDRLEAERDAEAARQALIHRKGIAEQRTAQAKLTRAISRIRAHDRVEID